MFDGTKPFKIDKPIRLIELFAGYGSQALALKYLGVPFEHWHICEWAVNSIQAYKDLHCPDDIKDYSVGLEKDEIYARLYRYGISADYENPLTAKQIRRMGEKRARTIYNNIQATRNLVSVTKVAGAQLEVQNTDQYCYIMTYSFPCQDLSLAGKGKGMMAGTRSGLLWEVKRILGECEELPQVLLMENVPQVIQKKHIGQFSKWIAYLDKLGYHSKWKLINGTDFDVPQNRERCFMVSVLGDNYYEFPAAIGCSRTLRDVLEPEVDQSYYLKTNTVIVMERHKARHERQGHGFGWSPVTGGGMHIPLRPNRDIGIIQPLLLRDCAKTVAGKTEIASALLARDHKGYGNQAMTAILEIVVPTE